MKTHAIQPVSPASTEFEKYYEAIEADLGRIRERAFALFHGTGQSDFDNWIQAERELFDVPKLDVDAGTATFEVPGFAPEELQLTVTPATLTLRGHTESETGRKDLFRHVSLEAAIDPKEVTAELRDGTLTVRLTAEKAVAAGA
jgi:HSP20 family molecular chaperone IbpA